MTERKRIACFFTGGYTELNAMKSFMKKINADADFIQLCPVALKKSREAIRNRKSIGGSQSGLTGASLINYVLEEVGEKYFVREMYDAILIEDDKDERFLNDGSDIDLGKWYAYQKDVRQQLALRGVTIPVIMFLAAPEVEAWFLSDWENSFGWVYKYSGKLDSEQNNYFSHRFREYVNKDILTERYADRIEAYGLFEKKYKKLSEEIQTALSTIDFLKNFGPTSIRYSKKTEGQAMLENIDPETVLRHCSVFFKEGYLALQNI